MSRQRRCRDGKEALRRSAIACGSGAERRDAFLENHERKCWEGNAVVQQATGASALADHSPHPDTQGCRTGNPKLFYVKMKKGLLLFGSRPALQNDALIGSRFRL